MDRKQGSVLDRLDWLVAAGFAAVSAVLYFASKADYVFPGESAHLMALLRGLDFERVAPYPLASFFARLFGSGNALAPACGAVATASVYLLTSFFVRLRVTGENMQRFAAPASRLAGVVAAVVFMLTPAVRSAATHLEPRMFAVAWALVAFLVAVPWSRSSKWTGRLAAVLFGALWGLGASDSPLFLALLPLAILDRPIRMFSVVALFSGIYIAYSAVWKSFPPSFPSSCGYIATSVSLSSMYT